MPEPGRQIVRTWRGVRWVTGNDLLLTQQLWCMSVIAPRRQGSDVDVAGQMRRVVEPHLWQRQERAQEAIGHVR